MEGPSRNRDSIKKDTGVLFLFTIVFIGFKVLENINNIQKRNIYNLYSITDNTQMWWFHHIKYSLQTRKQDLSILLLISPAQLKNGFTVNTFNVWICGSGIRGLTSRLEVEKETWGVFDKLFCTSAGFLEGKNQCYKWEHLAI